MKTCLGISLILLPLLWSPPELAKGVESKKPSSDVPQLVFIAPSHDFGQLLRGDRLTHEFAFQNIGKEVVKIIGIHAPCGCTIPKLEKTIYQPGEKGLLALTLDTTDFAGDLLKSIVVMTSEKLIPERILTVKAHIEQEFLLDPPVLHFEDLLLNSEQGRQQKILIKSAAPSLKLMPEHLKFNHNLIDVQIAQSEQQWEIQVHLKNDIPVGHIRETLLIKTTSKSLPELPVPIVGIVRGHIKQSPDYLDFGQLAFNESSERTVTLEGSSPFLVKSMVADILLNGEPVENIDEFIELKVADTEKAAKTQKVQVGLKNKEGNLKGALHGQVHFETELKGEKLSIDLYGLLLEKKKGRN